MPWQRTSQPGARSADDPAPKNLKGQDD